MPSDPGGLQTGSGLFERYVQRQYADDDCNPGTEPCLKKDISRDTAKTPAVSGIFGIRCGGAGGEQSCPGYRDEYG